MLKYFMTKVVIPLFSKEPMGTFTIKGAKEVIDNA
jgi:hypothetical protein